MILTGRAMSVTYEDVLAARETHAGDLTPTPLLQAYDLENADPATVYLKAESLQRTGSFKPRGVLNWIRTASAEELAQGLIAVSAGNHAVALAWAAQAAGVPVTVVMPAGSSPVKAAATRSYGAEVILHGDINEAWAKAEELRAAHGLTLVHPYDNTRVIAGQGTVGLELVEQMRLPPAAVLCPVGGGGLISGIGLALKRHWPDTRLLGVEPEGAATLRYAWQQGGPAALPAVSTIAPSLGANRAGEHTYAISREVVDDILLVSDDAIRQAMRAVLQGCRLVAEPGGVVGVAALLSGAVDVEPGDRVAAVLTGGNLDWDQLPELMP